LAAARFPLAAGLAAAGLAAAGDDFAFGRLAGLDEAVRVEGFTGE
jgi:hypothetical protein